MIPSGYTLMIMRRHRPRPIRETIKRGTHALLLQYEYGEAPDQFDLEMLFEENGPGYDLLSREGLLLPDGSYAGRRIGPLVKRQDDLYRVSYVFRREKHS